MFVTLSAGAKDIAASSRPKMQMHCRSRRERGHGNKIHLKELPDSPLFVKLQPPQLPTPPVDRLRAMSSLDRQDARQVWQAGLAGRNR